MTVWTPDSPPPGWASIAAALRGCFAPGFGAGAGRLCVVGYTQGGGGPEAVMTSDNGGASWADRGGIFPSGGIFAQGIPRGICFAPALGLVVAVGSDPFLDVGQANVSADGGATWGVATTPFAGGVAMFGVAANPAGDLLVAVDRAGAIWSSTDAVVWTPQTSPLTGGQNVRYIVGLDIWAAVGSSASEALATAPAANPAAWTLVSSPLDGGTAYDIAYQRAASKLYLGGFGSLGPPIMAASPDGGASWAEETTPWTASGFGEYLALAEAGATMLAAGDDGSVDQQFAIETDGSGVWTGDATPPNMTDGLGLLYVPELALAFLLGSGIDDTDAQTLVASAPFTPYTPPPPPSDCGPSRRQYRAVRGRIIVTDLLGAVTTWLERGSLLQADVTANLNLPSQIACQTRAGDPAVYSIFPADGDPLVAQSNRLVYIFLNEDPTAAATANRWRCRASGILMSPQDQADADIGTTHFTAYDPWQFFMGLPCFEDQVGTPVRQNGFLFAATPGNEIAYTMIQNTIYSLLALGLAGPGFFADIPNAYGGTIYWDGTNETTPALDFRVQQGTSLGQLLQQLTSAGSDISGTSQCIDIVFEPIYDPANRPGFCSQISIYDLAGSERPKAQMAWGRFQRSARTADREHDGTPGAFITVAQFMAGQGADSADWVLYPPLSHPASLTRYGPYWLQKFFPAEFDAGVVANLAVQALQLAKQGKRTFLVDVDPLRAAMPFRDYNIGDRVGVWTSHALRAPASGFQRVQTLPLAIGADGICSVPGLLTSPDWAEDEGS